MCAHPHATARLLCNFTGTHLMLKMDMDKTIVTEGRATVQRQATHHICGHRCNGLNRLLTTQTKNANFKCFPSI